MAGCATGKCLDVFDDNDLPASVISNGRGCMCWSNITLSSSNLFFDKFSKEKNNKPILHTHNRDPIFFQPILEHKNVTCRGSSRWEVSNSI